MAFKEAVMAAMASKERLSKDKSGFWVIKEN